jgi:hypothetical protein
MSECDTQSNELGPASYANFCAKAKGAPCLRIVEVPLYSDARFFGDVRQGAGPAILLNPIRVSRGRVEPSIVLRFSVHSTQSLSFPSSKPDLSRFSGASLFDEVASLLSLQYGARIVAGGITREFSKEDPLGSPRCDLEFRNMRILTPTVPPMLPWVSEEKTLHPGLLGRLHTLAPREALALLRSARSYRDALWIADADPQLSWLLLVSAVEVVAVHLAVPNEQDAEARLRSVAPDLVTSLDALGDHTTSSVAPHIAHLFKSTTRFLSFFKQFPPVPPRRRPPEGFQFRPWEEKHIQQALSVVYDWRSKALHAGIPFPPPMCEPPSDTDPKWEAPGETVPGLAAYTKGGVWTREQMPFALHLFEYLARTSLLAWWGSLGTSNDAAEQADEPDGPAAGTS